MKKLSLILSFFTLLLLSQACKPKKGDVGPAGATGAAGVAGPVGTANVIYTAWTPFATASWSTLSSEFSKNYRNYTIAAPGVTEAIRDQGVVLVYMRFSGIPNTALQLPFSYYNVNGAYTSNFITAITTSNITIKHSYIENNNDPGTISPSSAYRYVIIPGGVAGGRFNGEPTVGGTEYTATQIKAMSYEQVCQLLGLQP